MSASDASAIGCECEIMVVQIMVVRERCECEWMCNTCAVRLSAYACVTQ